MTGSSNGNSRSIPPDDHQHTVWIVEDEELFRRQLSELLALSDVFTCERTCGSCEEAIEALQNEIPPDLLLMDIGLPGMNGIEGTRRFKAIAPSVQVVMMTVFEDTEKIVQSIMAGASGYLLKGSSLEALVSSLSSILSGGAPITPQVARKVMEIFARLNPEPTDYGLTDREKEVLAYLVKGLVKKQIADQLGISFHTIDKHLRNIYSKLQVQSRTGAVAKALTERLL